MPVARGGSDTGRLGLTRESIVAAALELLDELGTDRFTMRGLAARLNTFPNNLYWHAGNRDRVLALAVDSALTQLAVPAPGSLTWLEWLAAAAREYRRVLHAHPNIAPLVASQVLVSPPSTGLVESVLAVLHGAGFDGAQLTHAYNSFVGSLVGWVSVELAEARAGQDDWQPEFGQALANLDPATHPTITAHHKDLADAAFALRWHSGRDRPLDDSFEVTLRVWLDGLVAVLQHSD